MTSNHQVGLFSIFDWVPETDPDTDAENKAALKADYRANPLGLIGFLLALPFLAVGAAVVAIVYVITRTFLKWLAIPALVIMGVAMVVYVVGLYLGLLAD